MVRLRRGPCVRGSKATDGAMEKTTQEGGDKGLWLWSVGPSIRARAHDDDGHDPGASGARYCRPARAHRGRALPPLLSRKRQGVGDVRRERILSRSIIKYGPGFAFLLLLNIPVVSCPYSCPVGHPAENTRRGNPTPHAPIDSRVPFHGGRNRSVIRHSFQQGAPLH
jgi:hypothetical protein